MIDDLHAYRLFKSIKLHFTKDGYDVRKYGFGNKISRSQLESRNERYMFHKLSKLFDTEEQLIQHIASNMFVNPKIWVGDLLLEESKDNYYRMRKVASSIEKYVLDDAKYIISSRGSLSKAIKSGEFMYDIIEGNINPETYVILNKIVNVSETLDNVCPDVIWSPLKMRLDKYGAFVKVPDIYFYEKILYNLKNIAKNS